MDRKKYLNEILPYFRSSNAKLTNSWNNFVDVLLDDWYKISLKNPVNIPYTALAQYFIDKVKCGFSLEEAEQYLRELPFHELPYFIMDKLIELRYDVFNLKEKGIAVYD